jgi:nucleotide-binding universal stress UspA family protein
MRRILVPLDGSPFGESVLPLAGSLAERMGGNLELVTVNPPDRHPDIPAGMIAEIASARGVGARLYVDTQAQELHRRFEIAVYTAVLDGPVSSAIAEHVRHDPPELIVMSTHGRSGPSRLFLGSVADRLLRELHCPFVLGKPGSLRELPATPRVLVPLDGSSLAESVVDAVARFFPCDQATLRLVRVVPPGEVLPVGMAMPLPAMAPDLMEARLEAASAYLERTAAKLRRIGWHVEHEVITDWHPSAAVLRSAADHRCDLIALATRGLGAVERVFLGSVADKVIRGTAVPVLVVNPSGNAASRLLMEQPEVEAAGEALEARVGSA